MAIQTIAWNEGTGSITLDYGGQGNGTIVITSDANNLSVARSQQITVRTTDGSNITRTVTISQAARAIKYLTFIARESGTFTFTSAAEYSLDEGQTWVSLAANTASPTLASGDTIMWRATITPTSYNGIGTFSATCNFDAEGTPMSLLFGDNFAGELSLSGKDYAFYRLFKSNEKIINAENLCLTATTLSESCYREMFDRCANLVTAVKYLPATIMKNNCYRSMYYNGKMASLPSDYLKSTSLADGCYKYMFSGCASLTSAPVLPAATLVANCYAWMFERCNKLNYIKCLATNIGASNCTTKWVNGVSGSGTFVKSADIASWTRGINGIPSGWTVVDYSS